MTTHRQSTSSQVEDDKQYDVVCIGAAGAYGAIILGGLWRVFMDADIDNVKTYIGTSIGSLIGYLLAIGFSPIEIILTRVKFIRLWGIRDVNITEMMIGGGAVTMDPYRDMIEQLTLDKIGYIPTLSELYTEFGKRLICCAYNVTRMDIEWLRMETHPDMLCIDAICMSSCVPFVFQPIKYNNSLYIDGGLGCMFPLGQAEMEGTHVLGISISRAIQPMTSVKCNSESVTSLMCIPHYEMSKHAIYSKRDTTDVIDIAKVGGDIMGMSESLSGFFEMVYAGANR
jgi:predicted acylesterase/phospholipase RssA